MSLTTRARAARRARDEAIAAAEAGSADWLPFAMLALDEAACRHQLLTSDEVWRVLTEHGVAGPTEPRAMGPLMLRGVRAELIQATSDFRIADEPATHRNHGRPQRVYRSLIYGDSPPTWPVRPKLQQALPW